MLKPLHHLNQLPKAAAMPSPQPDRGAAHAALPMDVVAWATWLHWGARGDARSLALLRHELVMRGIWAAALQADGWACASGEAPAGLQGRSPYEMALAAAAVALLAARDGGADSRRIWSRSGLQQALRRAEQTGPQLLTPDGAPMALACRLVQASTLLNPNSAAAAEQAQGQRLLQAVLEDPHFDTLPRAWKHAVWTCAADHHRRAGQPTLVRHFLGLLSNQNQAAAGLLARLRLGASHAPLGASQAASDLSA